MEYRFLHRKDAMLIAAIDILDKGGIQGLTSKEITKAEGLTDAAFYKHYSGKREIVAAILERFSAFDEKICNTILQLNMTEREGILFYASTYAENYQWYPQIATLLFSFDVYRYDPELKKYMTQTMDNRRKFLEDFITSCREKNESPGAIPPAVLANLVLGCIWNSIYFWKLKDETYDLKEEILAGIEALLAP